MAPLLPRGRVIGVHRNIYARGRCFDNAKLRRKKYSTGLLRRDLSRSITGAIHAIYNGPKSLLTLHQTTLSIPASSITADGEISNHSRLNVQADSDDLHRLAELASVIHPMANGIPAISGSANVTGTLQGTMQKPRISAHLNAQNLQVQGSDWKNADLTVQADSSRVVISNGALANAHRGQATFDAKVELHNWSYVSSAPIEAHISLRQMPISDLQRLGNVQYPISGDLSAKLSVGGSQVESSRLGFH